MRTTATVRTLSPTTLKRLARTLTQEDLDKPFWFFRQYLPTDLQPEAIGAMLFSFERALGRSIEDLTEFTELVSQLGSLTSWMSFLAVVDHAYGSK